MRGAPRRSAVASECCRPGRYPAGAPRTASRRAWRCATERCPAAWRGAGRRTSVRWRSSRRGMKSGSRRTLLAASPWWRAAGRSHPWATRHAGTWRCWRWALRHGGHPGTRALGQGGTGPHRLQGRRMEEWAFPRGCQGAGGDRHGPDEPPSRRRCRRRRAGWGGASAWSRRAGNGKSRPTSSGPARSGGTASCGSCSAAAGPRPSDDGRPARSRAHCRSSTSRSPRGCQRRRGGSVGPCGEASLGKPVVECNLGVSRNELKTQCDESVGQVWWRVRTCGARKNPQ
mmetsp:Transcript_6956/g.21787  ORF Transcript_6956/g.21787 Transcript_6956/m.21787 type:complete len:286 (-) Transcript_6956:18-875(-)